jgi:hypothetical protein
MDKTSKTCSNSWKLGFVVSELVFESGEQNKIQFLAPLSMQFLPINLWFYCDELFFMRHVLTEFKKDKLISTAKLSSMKYYRSIIVDWLIISKFCAKKHFKKINLITYLNSKSQAHACLETKKKNVLSIGSAKD